MGETIGELNAEHVLVAKRIALMRRTAMKKILTMPIDEALRIGQSDPPQKPDSPF